MANNNISVTVTHNISGGGGSGGTTAAEGINKDYQSHLQDLTRAISDLNNHFKGATSGGNFTNPFTGESKASADKRNDSKEAGANSAETFNNAVTDFSNAQKDHSDRMKQLMGGLSAIPIGASVGQWISAFSTSRALTAGSNLTDPVGYAKAQAQTGYEEKGAIYKGIGSAIGAFIGGGASLGAGTAIGAGIGYKAGDWANQLLNQSGLAGEQLSYEQSQTEAQLSRANPTGGVLSSLYHQAFSNKNGLLVNQLPYMSGSNAYSGNMSEGDLTGMAQFSKRYGLEGQSAGQASTLLAQIAGYMGDMNGTLHQIDAYQSQYGGDTLQQLSTLNTFLQAGSSPSEALNAAYKSGYQGQAFQNAQGAYMTSDFSSRLRQEAFGELQGFSVSKVMHGSESEAGLKKLHNAQARYALGRSASGVGGLSDFAVSSLMTEGAGMNFMMEHNAMPTSRSPGTFESFGLSTGEKKNIMDKINSSPNRGSVVESMMSPESSAEHTYEMGLKFQSAHIKDPSANQHVINELRHAEGTTHDKALIEKMNQLIKALNNLTSTVKH